MDSQQAWIEYDQLCELAQAAAEHDPDASAKWAARLKEARELATMIEHVERFDKCRAMGDLYPYVSADVVDALIERGA